MSVLQAGVCGWLLLLHIVSQERGKARAAGLAGARGTTVNGFCQTVSSWIKSQGWPALIRSSSPPPTPPSAIRVFPGVAVSSLGGVKSPCGSGYEQTGGRWAGLPPGKREAIGLPRAFEDLVAAQVLEKGEHGKDGKGLQRGISL